MKYPHDKWFTPKEMDRLYDILQDIFDKYMDADPDQSQDWIDPIIEAYGIIMDVVERAENET